MNLLAAFIFIGTIDSKDDFFATVELTSNPPQEQTSSAILPISAFPCTIEEGDIFYILKPTEGKPSVIVCAQAQPPTPIPSDEEGC